MLHKQGPSSWPMSRPRRGWIMRRRAMNRGSGGSGGICICFAYALSESCQTFHRVGTLAVEGSSRSSLWKVQRPEV